MCIVVVVASQRPVYASPVTDYMNIYIFRTVCRNLMNRKCNYPEPLSPRRQSHRAPLPLRSRRRFGSRVVKIPARRAKRHHVKQNNYYTNVYARVPILLLLATLMIRKWNCPTDSQPYLLFLLHFPHHLFRRLFPLPPPRNSPLRKYLSSYRFSTPARLPIAYLSKERYVFTRFAAWLRLSLTYIMHIRTEMYIYIYIYIASFPPSFSLSLFL